MQAQVLPRCASNRSHAPRGNVLRTHPRPLRPLERPLECSHAERGSKRKTWYDFFDNQQGLDMAIKDLKDNYELYIERFKKWMK